MAIKRLTRPIHARRRKLFGDTSKFVRSTRSKAGRVEVIDELEIVFPAITRSKRLMNRCGRSSSVI